MTTITALFPVCHHSQRVPFLALAAILGGGASPGAYL